MLIASHADDIDGNFAAQFQSYWVPFEPMGGYMSTHIS